MYSNLDPQGAQPGETSIIVPSLGMGELRESLIDEVMVSFADRFRDRPLREAVPTPEDIELLRQHCPWRYALDLYPGVTGLSLDRSAPVVEFAAENRVALSIRMSLLDKALTEFAPIGSFLDIGTDSGLIPLKLADRIGGRIVGVDRRTEAVRRAEVLQAIAVQGNCRFMTAEAYGYLQDLERDSFDCISVLGMVHQLGDPIRLLRLLYKKTARIVLVDTIIHNYPVPGWIQTTSRHSVSEEHELQPTYRGIIDSIYQAGFETVTEIVPAPSLLEAVSQPTVYHTHNRALFVAQKFAS